MKVDLLSKIEERSAKIGIIGLGYVGLPLALRFCEENFKVIGFDSDPKKVNMLKEGKSYIKYIPSSKIASFLSPAKPIFTATDDTSKLSEVDVIIICVPTPLTDKREPDMQYVEKTAKTVAKYLRPPQLISLESTTYPGTTEELILPILERKNLKVGKDFFLIFSPERENPGNEKYTSKAIPKIIGGVSPECLKVGIALYSKIVERVVPVSSIFHIPLLPETRKYKFHMKSVELAEESIKRYDCLLIATNHSVYDYKWILKNANLVVDTRNAIKESSSKVIKA